MKCRYSAGTIHRKYNITLVAGIYNAYFPPLMSRIFDVIASFTPSLRVERRMPHFAHCSARIFLPIEDQGKCIYNFTHDDAINTTIRGSRTRFLCIFIDAAAIIH